MTPLGPVLITGVAGFIAANVCRRLLELGQPVVGLDNFCDFYEPSIKRRRLQRAVAVAEDARRPPGGSFTLAEADLRDNQAVRELFAKHRPAAVIHLGAMAGVRPSIADPALYTQVNINGTVNLLQAAVEHDTGRFIFASSSSVYGNNPKVPFAEDDPVDHPISPYAATKKAGELICHTFWHVHGLPTTCLRFFTVYGPGQRPDLAIAKFMRLIRAGEPIPVFGDGSSSRDYTYIDDIVDGVLAALDRCAGYRIYNLGGSEPVSLAQMIATLEEVSGIEAKIDRQPMPPGDVDRTWADLTRSKAELGYEPRVPFREGVARQWAALLAEEGQTKASQPSANRSRS